MSIQETLSLLSNKTSRTILELIKEDKMSAGEIAEKSQMTPAATSYYLTRLKKAHLVYETKYKNYIYYEADLTVLDDVLQWINKLKEDN